MTMPQFDPARSAAMRAALSEKVMTMRLSRRESRRRWVGRGVFGLAGILVGAGVSGAAWAGGWIDGDPPAASDPPSAIAGPDGVTPGTPVITMLGDPDSVTITGSEDVRMPARPDAATHVRVWVTCLTVGSVSWGFDSDGNNPSSSCGAGDLGTTAWYDFALPGEDIFYVRAEAETRATVTFQYEHQRPTEWGVNAAGQTFGAATDAGSPDLVAVVGFKDDGSTVEGYAFATELEGPIPLPSDPDEATEYMEQVAELAEQYPDGYPVAVYESDGVTRIGTHYIALR